MTDSVVVHSKSEIEGMLTDFLGSDCQNAWISSEDGDVSAYVRKAWRILDKGDVIPYPSVLCFDLAEIMRYSNLEAYNGKHPGYPYGYFGDSDFMDAFMDVFEDVASRYGMSVYVESVLHWGLVNYFNGRGYDKQWFHSKIASHAPCYYKSLPGAIAIPNSHLTRLHPSDPHYVAPDPDYFKKLGMITGPLSPVSRDLV